MSHCVWFAGSVFDCLGDKDLLAVATAKDAVLASIIPASTVVDWDATDIEQVKFPPLNSTALSPPLYVLKPALGCQGVGILFVRNEKEVLEVITGDAERARAERGFIENVLASHGRMPQWVLQTYIPSMLILDDRRKFHLRAYVIVHEQRESENMLYFYDAFECRIANQPYTDDYSKRKAHITNGAGGSDTDRCMLHEVTELTSGNIGDIMRGFLRELFHPRASLRQLIVGGMPAPDMVLASDMGIHDVFALAALDVMIDIEGRPWLLEVNAKSPASPPQGMGSNAFQDHLVRFGLDLLHLAMGHQVERFVSM
jgi:hypothetical protein